MKPLGDLIQEGRPWLPLEWMDESLPTTFDNPDEFIVRTSEGFILGYPDDHDDAYHNMPLTPLDVINFGWLENFGEWTLVANEAGEFIVPGDYARQAEIHNIDWNEYINTSIDDALDSYYEYENEPDFGTEINAQAYTWHEIKLIFIAEPKPHFEVYEVPEQ
ncbi:MAG: hypothetical protein KDJ69_16770 [Nitratireductor sp.]|nr:hypothetical protein [Nitratireductor sp.]